MPLTWTSPSLLRAAGLLLGGLAATAQEVEPRAYQNAPVGVNFLIAGYGYTDGGLAFDPSSPLQDPQLETNNGLMAYARSMGLWGRSAKVDVIGSYGWLHGTARRGEELVSRDVNGLYDPKVRFSLCLTGAPALDRKDFARYQQDLVIGVSLQVGMPWGQYDPTRLVNLGSNRWSFKPEVGISKALGHWTLEGAAAVTFFTTNSEFYGDTTRSQDPLYAFQGHVVYGFRRGMWAAFDATYFEGGETTIGGTDKNDRQGNWRVGGTFALPVNLHHSVKLAIANGVSARTGNDVFTAALGWQYRWGGGF